MTFWLMFVVVGDDLKILLIIYRKVFEFSATSFKFPVCFNYKMTDTVVMCCDIIPK